MLFGVRREIFWLGIVSFLTDVSSEMVFSVLAIFLTEILHASVFVLGAMEGMADFAASSLDMFSGYLSDKTGKRKSLALAGYGLSSLSKLLLIAAHTIPAIVAFRIVERLGKSIRGAPRDALISSISESKSRGYAFGLHKAMDKSGAILGPFVAYLLLSQLGQQYSTFRIIFGLAIILAFAAVFVLALSIKEPNAAVPRERPSLIATYRSMSLRYKCYLGAAALFSMSYFSFSFLLLQAYQAGFSAKEVALLYGLCNLSFSLLSIPLGRLGDAFGRPTIIVLEYAIFAAVCLGFAFGVSKASTLILFLVYGIFFAIDEGQTKAFVSDLVPVEMTGTALGVYNSVTGFMYLPASLIFGALWKYYSPAVAFEYSAATALAALVLFILTVKIR